MAAAAQVTPDAHSYVTHVHVVTSAILRFGIATALLLLLGVIQVGIHARELPAGPWPSATIHLSLPLLHPSKKPTHMSAALPMTTPSPPPWHAICICAPAALHTRWYHKHMLPCHNPLLLPPPPPNATPHQVLAQVLLLRRVCGHPLHCFLDLLHLANTSILLLEEHCAGYYLHGRNHMVHAGMVCACPHPPPLVTVHVGPLLQLAAARRWCAADSRQHPEPG